MTIAQLIEIALAGGREVIDVYGSEIDATLKSDSSPVTQADIRCEAVVTEALSRMSPDIPVVAEEAAAGGSIPETCEIFYLVDPLDGTKEFINRNGDFTVNIALIDKGVPVSGIVYAPALNRLWVGADGEGAFEAEVVDGAAGPLKPIRARTAPEAITAVGSRSHGSDATKVWLERYAVENLVSRGSSLKFCLVASGEADVYPRLGRTMEWDTAAGDAVLRAAGGLVTTLDGAPLLYGKRGQSEDVDFANPHFVAYGDRALIGQGAKAPA